MKKKNFITLLIGTVGGLLFAIGMCMCLLPEWNAFLPGVVVTAIGGVTLLVLGIVRFVMSGAHISINWRAVGKVAFGVFASLVLGVGMCMIMVWKWMVPGIIVGVFGVALLVCLAPICLGFKED